MAGPISFPYFNGFLWEIGMGMEVPPIENLWRKSREKTTGFWDSQLNIYGFHPLTLRPGCTNVLVCFPSPVIVTTKTFICLGSGILINLHLPLGKGGQRN